MCDKNPDCPNSKTLVLDTNFLDQVNRTIKIGLGSKTLGKPLEKQRPIFLNKAQKIVSKYYMLKEKYRGLIRCDSVKVSSMHFNFLRIHVNPYLGS